MLLRLTALVAVASSVTLARAEVAAAQDPQDDTPQDTADMAARRAAPPRDRAAEEHHAAEHQGAKGPAARAAAVDTVGWLRRSHGVDSVCSPDDDAAASPCGLQLVCGGPEPRCASAADTDCGCVPELVFAKAAAAGDVVAAFPRAAVLGAALDPQLIASLKRFTSAHAALDHVDPAEHEGDLARDMLGKAELRRGKALSQPSAAHFTFVVALLFETVMHPNTEEHPHAGHLEPWLSTLLPAPIARARHGLFWTRPEFACADVLTGARLRALDEAEHAVAGLVNDFCRETMTDPSLTKDLSDEDLRRKAWCPFGRVNARWAGAVASTYALPVPLDGNTARVAVPTLEAALTAPVGNAAVSATEDSSTVTVTVPEAAGPVQPGERVVLERQRNGGDLSTFADDALLLDGDVAIAHAALAVPSVAARVEALPVTLVELARAFWPKKGLVPACGDWGAAAVYPNGTLGREASSCADVLRAMEDGDEAFEARRRGDDAVRLDATVVAALEAAQDPTCALDTPAAKRITAHVQQKAAARAALLALQ